MKYRWIWPMATFLLILLAAYQFDTIRQLRSEIRWYEKKVANAFRYTARHMDLSGLPEALEALVAQPGQETLARAESASRAYTEMLFQLNDLRESGPPSGHGGLQTGTYAYHPSTQGQADLQMQILRAEIEPSLSVIGVQLEGDNWQLRAEDRQFLAEITQLVRRLNERLAAVDTALQSEIFQPTVFTIAKQTVGQIGPDLEEIARLVKARQATLPTK